MPEHFLVRSECRRCCSASRWDSLRGNVAAVRGIPERDPILGLQPVQFIRRAEVIFIHVPAAHLQHFTLP